MAFKIVDAVPYLLAILAVGVGYALPEFFLLLLVTLLVAVYGFVAPKPVDENPLLLSSFFAGVAAHWSAGRAFAGGGLAQFTFLPYALWGLSLGLAVIWAREKGERAGYAFSLGAVLLPLAMGPASFAGKFDAMILSGVLLAAGAILAIRGGAVTATRIPQLIRASISSAIPASLAAALAFLLMTVSAFTLPGIGELALLYVNLVWYSLVPTVVAIGLLVLMHSVFFSATRQSSRASIAPAVFEEG